jgi:hypothetical protein
MLSRTRLEGELLFLQDLPLSKFSINVGSRRLALMILTLNDWEVVLRRAKLGWLSERHRHLELGCMGERWEQSDLKLGR